MIKVVLAVSKPLKAVPLPPVNEIRYYHFTVIQTTTNAASVLVEDESNPAKNPFLKYH